MYCLHKDQREFVSILSRPGSSSLTSVVKARKAEVKARAEVNAVG